MKVATISGYHIIYAPLSKRKYTFDIISRSSKLDAEKDNCSTRLEDHKY